MAQAGSGAALAHYLGQPDATPAVCSRESRGPHVGPLSARDFSDLSDGLLDATIPPALWRRCAAALFVRSPEAESARFLDAMGRAYRTLLRDGDLETRSSLKAELDALHQTFLSRPPAVEPTAGLLASLVDDLRSALTHQRLGPIGTAYGRDLVTVLDLERGIWEGRPVTVGTLDQAMARTDEATLRRFALRLPDPTLRTEARRRIVRLHIAASAWPEVLQHAAEVESAVLATGRNAVDVAQHPPVRGSIDPAHLPTRDVLGRQDVGAQTVTFLGYGGPAPGLSVMPEIDLRGALLIELLGVSRPVSLCDAADSLGVAPCVRADDVTIDSPLSYPDGDGTFHFVDHVSSSQAVSLAGGQPQVDLPIKVAGILVFTLALPLYFERPSPLLFSGSTGAAGPGLRLAIQLLDGQRLVFTVEAGKRPLVAVVERRDAGDFAIVSRGGDGYAGSRGRDGSDGLDGSPGTPASCPMASGGNGGDGSPGENGGRGEDGGAGGPGADIRVEVACDANECGPLFALLKPIVRSEGGSGGPGGPGGRGGRGGNGGPGGSGTLCTDSNGNAVTLPAGLTGRNGPDGTDGFGGAQGANGAPGQILFTTAGRGR
jgi:hypothetical protein